MIRTAALQALAAGEARSGGASLQKRVLDRPSVAGMARGLALAVAMRLGSITGGVGDPAFVDTVIAGVVLGERQTSTVFIREHGGSEADGGAGLGVWRYANETQSEVLEFHRHPGSMSVDFLEFEVRAGAPSTGAPAQHTRLRAFQSAKGIRLGLTVAEVLKRLGPPCERRKDNTGVVLIYACSPTKVCPALATVNVPEYRSEYRFVEDALVAFKAGYPYP